MWKPFIVTDKIGSEGGTILDDEEYNGECRITRERCKKYDAITCGVYGDMVHTTFASAEESKIEYEQMKKELAEFIDNRSDNWHECSAFYDWFTNKH